MSEGRVGHSLQTIHGNQHFMFPPRVTPLTEPFWSAAADGRLVVQRCADCGTYVFRPEAACTNCLSSALSWQESSGEGVIYSYTRVRRRADEPSEYVLAIIELSEGWHMLTRLLDADAPPLAPGMPVHVAFVEVDGAVLPCFTLASPA